MLIVTLSNFYDEAEIMDNRDPEQYLLTLEQMIENDYPVPSYLADVFQKPPGWVETIEQPKESILIVSEGKPKTPRKIYSIDCEMVRLPPALRHNSF